MPAAVLFAGLLAMTPRLVDGVDFKAWWAVCDNVRACTAYGFPPEAEQGAVLRLRREASAGAAAGLDLAIATDPAKGVEGPLDLAVDGKVLARTGPPEAIDDAYRRWPLAKADTPAMLDALARGQVLEARDGERIVAAISLAGLSATLRWIDDSQKRAGGVTAVVAKGAAPASAVPPPPLAPRVHVAAPVSQAGLPATPPRAVRARLRGLDCQLETSEPPSAARLAPGVVLWLMPCGIGAYQITSALLLADEKGGHVRFVDLGGEGDAAERTQATNAVYDPKTRMLHAYAKGRGLADCGFGTTHAWTGKAFVRTEQTEMPVCRGLTRPFWVTTFQSR